MKIPEIRAELIALSYEVGDDKIARRIRYLAEATRRRSPVRRAKVKKSRLTPQMAERIRRYANAHPNDSYLEMSIVLETNIGRISEALGGFRT